MPFIRTIISLIYVGLFMLASLILLPVEFFIRKKNPVKAVEFSYKVITIGFRALIFLSGSAPKVYGLENIPKDRPVVFMGNHRSYYDLIISYTYMPCPTAIYSKIGLKKAPAISSWMKRINCIFLEAGNMRQYMQAILDGIELIKNGTSMLIFPEGKRNKGEGVLEFHAGSFKLATKTGAAIVPVVQTRTREIFEKHFPWLHAQKTTLEFLPPIETSGLSKEEQKSLPAYTRELILKAYLEPGKGR